MFKVVEFKDRIALDKPRFKIFSMKCLRINING